MIQNEVVRRIPSAEFWGTHLARRHAVAHYVPEQRGTAGFLAPFDPNPHGAYVGYRTQRCRMIQTLRVAADRPRRGSAKAPSLPSQRKSRVAVSPDQSAHQNHLLDALPATDYQRVASHLELILLGLGDVLYQPGGGRGTPTSRPRPSFRCCTSWRMGRRPKSRSSATRACLRFPSS